MGSEGEELIILFRPVGVQELRLIEEAHFKRFPPRLHFQPFFYPVLNVEYAEAIARDWNTKDAASGFAGYVTRFAVKRDFIARYDVRIVGAASVHQEYWIPAEELEEFNDNIVGKIDVIREFKGTAPQEQDKPVDG